MAKVQLLKLSEKSRMRLQRILYEPPKRYFRSILASVYRPNLRLERCSYSFRTVSLGNPLHSTTKGLQTFTLCLTLNI